MIDRNTYDREVTKAEVRGYVQAVQDLLREVRLQQTLQTGGVGGELMGIALVSHMGEKLENRRELMRVQISAIEKKGKG